MIDKFIACKNGTSSITYVTPLLEPILKDTYGQIVYQEQVMQIAQSLGGYSLGQADLLRRAMGKKKPAEMEKQREMFISGCTKNGVSQAVADQLFNMMVQFAEYCFNRSHSQAYAMLTYQTAYLKTHYPVEYMTALLSSVSADKDKVQNYIAECQAMNIDILPPDVNVSGNDFTADGKAIRFGLSAIKNVGEAAINDIVIKRQEGSYKSVQDFLSRIDLRIVNKRALESLIKCGACLSLNITRKQALENLERLVETFNRRQLEQSTGQISLFSLGTNKGLNMDQTLIGDSNELQEAELQTMEHELLGFYITSHPLKRVANRLRWLTTHSLKDLRDCSDGANVIVGGLIAASEKKLTKQNKLIGIFRLEDLASQIEAVAYSELLETLPAETFATQSLVLIKGKVKKSEDDVSLLATSVRKISEAAIVSIYFLEEQSFAQLQQLKQILSNWRGDDPVMLNFPKGTQNQPMIVGSQFWVKASPELINNINHSLANKAKVLISKVTV
jgi:DNA polymerase-3 subunit alpha